LLFVLLLFLFSTPFTPTFSQITLAKEAQALENKWSLGLATDGQTFVVKRHHPYGRCAIHEWVLD
jgi:hypothetical protein